MVGLSAYGNAVFWFGVLGATVLAVAAHVRSAPHWFRSAVFLAGWFAWVGWIAFVPRNAEDRAGWLIALSGALIVWNVGFLVGVIRLDSTQL